MGEPRAATELDRETLAGLADVLIPAADGMPAASEVEVINDSELVARQIGGEYKVKHAGLKPLFLEATRALRGFDGWSVRAVRRGQNSRADALVNEALDEAASS